MAQLNDDWYGARKKHYSVKETLAWVSSALNSAKDDFASLASALANRKKPIETRFFKVFVLSDKKCLPMFKLLRPRRFASLVEAASEMSDSERTQLWKSVFQPYLGDWDQIISIIDNRIPGRQQIIEFRQAFVTISSLQHQMITEPSSATKEAIKQYMDAFDRFWPRWEMLAAILPVGCTAKTNGAIRGKYDKYCLKNAVLAALFDVDLKTISRWKTADTPHAQEFRACRDSRAKMENLARIFKAQREYGRVCTARGRKVRSRVSYSEDIGADDEESDS